MRTAAWAESHFIRSILLEEFDRNHRAVTFLVFFNENVLLVALVIIGHTMAVVGWHASKNLHFKSKQREIVQINITRFVESNQPCS